jgi:hypothetical protein
MDKGNLNCCCHNLSMHIRKINCTYDGRLSLHCVVLPVLVWEASSAWGGFSCTEVGGFLCMGLFYLYWVGRHAQHYVVLPVLGREASSQFVVLPILGWETSSALCGFTCTLVRGILCMGWFYLYWGGRLSLHGFVFIGGHDIKYFCRRYPISDIDIA